MNKNTIIGIIAVAVILIAGVFVVSKTNKNPQVSTNNQNAVYCGSDSELTSTQPIQSHRNYCIKYNSDAVTFTPNTPAAFTFSIIDDEGNTLKDFDTVHEKTMHFIAVRKDLANFQHVHPEFNSTTGEFTLSNLTLPSDGEYRLFADFTPTGSMMGPNGMKLPVTISQDVRLGNMASYKPGPIGSPTSTETVDGYQFTLTTTPQAPATGSENKLTFDIRQNGKPVTDLEKYLGALGHSVILSEGDLQFIHGHPVEDPSKPQTGKVNFMVDFPEVGKYKVFTQFQRSGKIMTTDFVVNVGEGAESSSEVEQGGSMMH